MAGDRACFRSSRGGAVAGAGCAGVTAAAVTRSCRLGGINDRVTAAGTRPDRRHESQRRFAFKEQRRRLNLRGRCICRRRVVSGSQIFLLVQLARSRLTIGLAPPGLPSWLSGGWTCLRAVPAQKGEPGRRHPLVCTRRRYRRMWLRRRPALPRRWMVCRPISS